MKKFLKTFLWPINKNEYKKFIPIIIIFFLISFNYNLLRIFKDTLIITAPNSGAQTIPFVKMWIMLPCAILITYIFTKISNKFGRNRVFYTMMSIFLCFFIIFTLMLYPAREFLCPKKFTDTLFKFLPVGIHGMVSLIRNWIYTLFYVMSELWGTIILTVLFWGFVNTITSIDEAKRFYGLFGVGANIASIISGKTTILLSKIKFSPNIPFGQTSWDQTILFLNGLVIIIGLLIILIFYFLSKKVPQTPKKEVLAKKTSFKEKFLYLTKSKYLISIAIIVMSYNITINLVEVIWKNQVKIMYPSANDYNSYMGQVTILIGILSTLVALFLCGNFLRKFTWTFNALIAPIIVLITGGFFFSFFLFKESFTTFSNILGFTPLVLSVIFGTVHNCFTRASKYTIFDATKEISFIPLTEKEKTKGKAAIDGVGSRIGKSGGAIIHQTMLIIFSTLSATAPYIAGIFFIVIAMWMLAVNSLGKQFETLTKKSAEPQTTE